jgi:hypothetical protein
MCWVKKLSLAPLISSHETAPVEFKRMIASIGHPAYDLSAIRQIEGARGFERGTS